FLLLFLHQGKKSKQRLRPFVEKKSALPARQKVNRVSNANPRKKTALLPARQKNHNNKKRPQ
ncbi:MAG: hypothetical protein ABW007_02180, partial [Chitinophagaceae bacterium]